MNKILILSFGIIFLIGVISASCLTTYSGSLTINTGSICDLPYPLYIISYLDVQGFLNVTNNILFHKSGGTGDTLRVVTGGKLLLNSGHKIESVTSSGTCKYPAYGIAIGCINEACMDCVCVTLGDSFCCGYDAGAGLGIGWWDETCSGSMGTDAMHPTCSAVC